MWHLFRISIISVTFLHKGKLVLKSLLSVGRYFRRGGGSLLSGFANTRDILLLLSEIHYFQGVVILRTLQYFEKEKRIKAHDYSLNQSDA